MRQKRVKAHTTRGPDTPQLRSCTTSLPRKARHPLCAKRVVHSAVCRTARGAPERSCVVFNPDSPNKEVYVCTSHVSPYGCTKTFYCSPVKCPSRKSKQQDPRDDYIPRKDPAVIKFICPTSRCPKPTARCSPTYPKPNDTCGKGAACGSGEGRSSSSKLCNYKRSKSTKPRSKCTIAYVTPLSCPATNPPCSDSFPKPFEPQRNKSRSKPPSKSCNHISETCPRISSQGLRSPSPKRAMARCKPFPDTDTKRHRSQQRTSLLDLDVSNMDRAGQGKRAKSLCSIGQAGDGSGQGLYSPPRSVISPCGLPSAKVRSRSYTSRNSSRRFEQRNEQRWNLPTSKKYSSSSYCPPLCLPSPPCCRVDVSRPRVTRCENKDAGSSDYKSDFLRYSTVTYGLKRPCGGYSTEYRLNELIAKYGSGGRGGQRSYFAKAI